MTWDAGPFWTHRMASQLAGVLKARCRQCVPDLMRLTDAADARVSDAAVLRPLAEQAFLAADPVIRTMLEMECYRDYERLVGAIFAESKAAPAAEPASRHAATNPAARPVA